MADEEIEGMNIDINMGATIHMEELKAILEQIVAVFREIANGTASAFNGIKKKFKESADDMVEAGEKTAKKIKEATDYFKDQYTSMFKDATKLINKPIDAIESFVTSGLKNIGSDISKMLGDSLFSAGKVSAEQITAKATMDSIGMIGGGAIGGAGAGAGVGAGATAASGGTLLPVIIAIGVVAAAIAVLTKIIEVGFSMLDGLFNSLIEGPMKVISAGIKIISVPMQLLGSVLAEMMVPFLDVWMQIARIFLPMIQKLREDYYTIYEKLIDEGAGPMEAAMGASYGAIAGFIFDLFLPIAQFLNRFITDIVATSIWYFVQSIQWVVNVLVDLANVFGLNLEKVKLIDDDLDTFRTTTLANSDQAFKDNAAKVREVTVELGILVGREYGKVLDGFIGTIEEETTPLEEALQETEENILDTRDTVSEFNDNIEDGISEMKTWQLELSQRTKEALTLLDGYDLTGKSEKETRKDMETQLFTGKIAGGFGSLPGGFDGSLNAGSRTATDKELGIDHKGSISLKIEGGENFQSDVKTSVGDAVKGVLSKYSILSNQISGNNISNYSSVKINI